MPIRLRKVNGAPSQSWSLLRMSVPRCITMSGGLFYQDKGTGKWMMRPPSSSGISSDHDLMSLGVSLHRYAMLLTLVPRIWLGAG